LSNRDEDRTVVCKYLIYSYKTKKDGITHNPRLPLVNIYLKSATADYDTIALVDSGATRTIIPLDLAEILSLQFERVKDGSLWKAETEGAGATFYCNAAILQRLVIKKHTAPFCSLTNIHVLVPENRSVLPYVVLGRDYVFNRFDITFHETRQKITFTRI
jgi:hypothetical protein